MGKDHFQVWKLKPPARKCIFIYLVNSWVDRSLRSIYIIENSLNIGSEILLPLKCIVSGKK